MTMKLEKQLNAVYKERNAMVQVLSFLYPSHLQKDPQKPLWPVVCIHIPVRCWTGDKMYRWVEEQQVTWHIPKKELKYFNHLEFKDNHWDGHDTNEKYTRLGRIAVKNNKRWYEFWKDKYR